MSTDLAAAKPGRPRPRSTLRAVAVPSEHGGWGLSAEPALLGLLVAPSLAGLALGAAAVVAFVARTPLKAVLVDRWRHRWLARTAVAARVAAVEIALLAALVAVAALRSRQDWWAPLLVAVPLVAVEMWFDMRSRSRRLVPEVCGAVGVASVAAAIAVAGGTSWPVAIGLWIVLASRSVSSIPFARAQVRRTKGHTVAEWPVAAAQAAALAAVGAGWAAGAVPLAAVPVIGFVGAGSLWWLRRPPPSTITVGVVEVAVGLAIVAVTGLAVRLA